MTRNGYRNALQMRRIHKSKGSKQTNGSTQRKLSVMDHLGLKCYIHLISNRMNNNCSLHCKTCRVFIDSRIAFANSFDDMKLTFRLLSGLTHATFKCSKKKLHTSNDMANRKSNQAWQRIEQRKKSVLQYYCMSGKPASTYSKFQINVN